MRHLLAANTAAWLPDTTLLRDRIALLRREPITVITDKVIDRWLTAGFRERHPETENLCHRMLGQCGAAPYADTAEMICRMDLRPLLSGIDCRCTVVTGDYDLATPAAWGEAAAAAIPRARCIALPTAHLANLEAAAEFTALLRQILEGGPPTGSDLHNSLH